eukprot:Transcript_13091.p1 GENE.Transcript_13091~~Transcript_13091.p1  ORF type:complete len:506 (-),score=202.27 Transcript_13091:1411-2928(-)
MLHTLTNTPPHLLRAPPALGLGPPPQFFTEQRQDHFDESNPKKWSQAFYVNDTFWEPGSDAPVYLCVGGEGPALSGAVVVASAHCNNAVEWLPETKALMFAVEHRYYGCHNASACPYSADDKEPLKWLSSHQALADLAAFRAFAAAKWKLTAANKWVSFGGSYPGMLAGWFRVKYPSLVHAAVASSAPVQAKVDMQEYNDIVASAYAIPTVGGSAACMDAIASGHAAIGKLMNTSAGRKQLEKQFGLGRMARLDTHAGQQRFAGGGVASFPAQSNDPTCTRPGCDINHICQVMTSDGPDDAVARLARLRKLQRTEEQQEQEQEQQERQHQEQPPPMVEAATGSAGGGARRRLAGVAELHRSLDYWGWQTCNEFGFYQTCEVGSGCFFTQGLVLLPDEMGFCQELYQISPATVAANVAASNKFYGGARPDLLSPPATRVLYPNGNVDPWHGLSVLSAPTPQLPVLMVDGASHHAWTHPSAPTDQPTVVAARAAIRQQVAAWLAEDN